MDRPPADFRPIVEIYEELADWFLATRTRDRLPERKYLDQMTRDLRPGGAILDLGCGTGQPIAGYLAARGFRITGVDGAPRMVALARELLPEQRWIVADMRTLGLGEVFDAIIAWDSFFHLSHDEQRAMFPVFAGHLGSGGLLLFTSGPAHGIAVGDMRGHALFHASLSSEEYRALLAREGFEVLVHQVEDPECGAHTVWLSRKTL